MKAMLTKAWSFDAAHRLPDHDGKCAREHGHTYRVEVSIFGEVRDEPGHPKNGMVEDLGDLSAWWEQHLEPLLDHRNLNDSIEVSMGGRPTTAENLAGWVFQQAMGHGFAVCKVRVYETPTGCATVYA